MTFIHSKDTVVLVDQYDPTLLFTKAAPNISRDMHSSDTLGISSHQFLQGLRHGTLALMGLFNSYIDTTVFNAIFGTPGSLKNISYMPEGSAVGKPAMLLYALVPNYGVESMVSDIVKTTAQCVASEDGYDQGVSLHALGAEVGTVNGTTYDNAAATANGWAAFLHVTAMAGAAPSVVVKIQHSTDGSSWNDLGSAAFTAATAATTQRLEGAAGVTVNRYRRIVATFGGTTTSITFQVGFAGRS